MSPSHNTAADELPVIEVKNLTKEYRLGALEGLRATAKRLLGRAPEAPKRQFKALDDVSFSVKRGEVVGIIGHNGAGKSTLLKHLCQITTPTSGSVTVRGQVAPLIEVGAGLVGDMTGRENIYLNASILGLTRAEIDGKVDKIIAFAELESFIDTPIKRYSSGMQVRLGYAIATAVKSEVLIVDEVLAVGDIAFQRKCIRQMMSMMNESNRTILIVGHNIRQLQRLCTRLIMLDHGRLVCDGEPDVAVQHYYRELDQQSSISAPITSITKIEDVDSVKVIVRAPDGQPTDKVDFKTALKLDICIALKHELPDGEVAVAIRTTDQIYVATQSSGRQKYLKLGKGANLVKVRFPSIPLLPSEYAVRIYIGDSGGAVLFDGDDLARFRVVDSSSNRAYHSGSSLVDLEACWELAPSEEKATMPVQ